MRCGHGAGEDDTGDLNAADSEVLGAKATENSGKSSSCRKGVQAVASPLKAGSIAHDALDNKLDTNVQMVGSEQVNAFLTIDLGYRVPQIENIRTSGHRNRLRQLRYVRGWRRKPSRACISPSLRFDSLRLRW